MKLYNIEIYEESHNRDLYYQLQIYLSNCYIKHCGLFPENCLSLFLENKINLNRIRLEVLNLGKGYVSSKPFSLNQTVPHFANKCHLIFVQVFIITIHPIFGYTRNDKHMEC